MLEIIALVFLSRNIGDLAVRKGLKRGWWRFYTVLAWFGAEIIGIVLALLIFQSEEAFLAIYLFAIAFAVGSYLLLRLILSRKPDADDHSFEFEAQKQQQQMP